MKFELEEYHRNVPKEEFIADLKRVALKLKKNTVTHEDYNKNGKFHSSTLQRKFGSWFTALKKAGLEKTRNLDLKDNDLITELIRVANLLKKDSLTQIEYDEYGQFDSSTFYRRFGSWFKALEKAGLKKTRNLGITEEEYFKNLEEIWTKLGRQPHYNDMRKPLSKYASSAYAYRFGTWRKALEKFVEYINQEEIPAVRNVTTVPVVESYHSNPLQKHKTKRNISWRLRFIVMKQNNFKCKSCGRAPATDPKIILHVDHIFPYAKGGETILENLQTLCSVCNIGKSNL